MDLWRILVFILKQMLHNEFPLFNTKNLKSIEIYCTDGVRRVYLTFPDKKYEGKSEIERLLKHE